MSVKRNKQQQADETAINLKAQEKAHLNPDSNLKTGKSGNQSSAAAMNASVQQDVAAQEAEAAEAAEKLKGAQDNFDEKSAALAAEQEEERLKKQIAIDLEKEIEARAEARYQEKLKSMPKHVVASVPEAVVPSDHVSCCVRTARILGYLEKLLDYLPSTNSALNTWWDMLEKLQLKVEAKSKTPPKFKLPKKMLSFGKIRIEGETPKAVGIYESELRGHCQNLLDVLADFPGTWQGPLVKYTKALLKAIQ